MADSWGENDKVVTDFGADDEVVQDSPLGRGWKKAKQAMSITGSLTTGDSAGAAQTVKEADDYARANPGSKEGAKLMDAWNRGDGITGGVKEVAGQIGDDYNNAKGFLPGAAAVGRDLKAMGAGVLEQVPNMVAPVGGMIAGGAGGAKLGGMAGGAVGAAAAGVGAVPGAAIGATIGGAAGAWAGASAGNTAVEGGGIVQDAIQKAGIDPQDTAAVQAYLDEHGSKLLGQAATKGAIIGAVDTLTAGVGGRILNAPARAAADRALVGMGVDVADQAAVKAAMATPDFATRIGADTVYQASHKGIGHVAREAAVAGIDPAGEFAGEYLGSGVATDNWDAKNAALEAISSVGQSGAMYAGQKVYQRATAPLSTAAEAGGADTGTPGAPGAPEQPSAPGALPGQNTPAAQAGKPGAVDSEGLFTGEIPASEKLGLNPSAGPLSGAAALAVDTGTTQQLADQAALQQADEQAGKDVAANEKENKKTAPKVDGKNKAPGLNTDLIAKAVALRDKSGRTIEQDMTTEQLQARLAGMEKGSVTRSINGEPVEVQRTQPVIDAMERVRTELATRSTGDRVDPATGEITKTTPQDAIKDLQAQLDYVTTQSKATGWNTRSVAMRDQIKEDIAAVQRTLPAPETANANEATESQQAGAQRAQTPAEGEQAAVQAIAQPEGVANATASQTTAAEGIAQSPQEGALQEPAASAAQPLAVSTNSPNAAPVVAPAESWATMNKADRAAVAEKTDIKTVLRKNLAGAKWENLNVEVQAKLAEAMAPKAAVERNDGTTEVLDGGMTIVHGSGNPGMKAEDIQIVRADGQKQGKAGRVYGGFYGTTEQDAAQAEGYAGMMGGTPTLYDVKVKPGTKVLNKTGDITRLSEAYINELVSQGYGVVTGKDPRGRTEHVVIDKNAIQEIGARKGSQQDAAPNIQGKAIDNDWAEFSKDSGTLGVPRADMPQIKAEHRGAMVNFLNARGIAHQEGTVPASELKPTQKEFSREKVAKALGFEGGNRSILVSSDGYVLDGHHQWMAAREKGEEVKAIRLDAPMSELLSVAREFPSATTDDASATAKPADKPTAKATDKPKKPRGVLAKKREAEVAARAKHFTPGNVVRSYGGLYDRVVSYDESEGGAWSVRVQSVDKKGDTWVDTPGQGERSHTTQPEARDMKSGPVGRVEPAAAPTEAAAEEVPAKGPLEIPEKQFGELLSEMGQAEEGIPYFTAPTEMVRTEKRAEPGGVMPAESAKALVDEWEAHAKAQGKSRVNSDKVVLSLFDTSGEWSQPWVDAGYQVHRFDIQDGMDINDFSVEYLTEKLGIERADIIIAAPPCTDFSISGAHAWKKKDADGRTEASVDLVRQTLATVEFFKPSSWAMENPVGRIQKLTGLPKAAMSFQPNNFGDPYTKRTLLWGDFNTELPLANVEPVDGSKMTTKLSGRDKYERSLTPKGFAYSFFMANNLADMSVADGLAREFKGIPVAEFQAAVDAGVDAPAIRTAIEDAYNDQDLDAARADLAALAPPTDPKPGLKFSRSSKGREYPLAPPGTRYEETSIEPTMMTPDQYLASVRPLTLDDESRDSIDALKEHIESGRKLDPLVIYPGGQEDGRHRAYAAKELGIKQVPVILHAGWNLKFSKSAAGPAADMYLGHNLSAEKLRHALNLGGLAAPSLAVSRTTTGGIEGFGDITLLAPKELIGTRDAPLFNADIYSPRQPRAQHKINRRAFQTLDEKLRALPGSLRRVDEDEFQNYGLAELGRSEALKLQFLKDQGVEIKMPMAKVSPAVRQAVAFANKNDIKQSYNLRENEQFAALAKRHAEADLAAVLAADPGREDRYRSVWFNEDGSVSRNYLHELATKAANYINNGGVDRIALSQAIAKKLRDKQTEASFDAYIRDLGKTLSDGEVLRIGNKTKPYTLENVTTEMIRELRGGEGFNYGAGNVRAQFAAKIGSLKEAQNRRDEIVSKGDFEKAKDESQNRLFETLEALKPYYRFDANGWNYSGDASSAIAEGEKGLREAFKLDVQGRKLVSDYVSYVRNLPTEYFEMKVQRSMDIGEFSAAVVPRGTPDDLIQALKEKGVKIVTYGKGEGSRIKAIAKFKDLQFSFAGARAESADTLALANAKQRIGAGENANTVRKETGWGRGADGKWRFEISDHQAKVRAEGSTFEAIHGNTYLDNPEGVTAGALLDHPQLFAAYPELANVPVGLMPGDATAQARLRRSPAGISIQLRGDTPRSKVASNLLHELQHGIQGVEGFASGGSKKALISEFDKTGAITYKRLAGEVEARNTQARMKMTPRQRAEIAPQESADTPDSQVLVTFNGRDMVDLPAPKNAGTPASITDASLVRAFGVQFPQLAPAVRKLLARGKAGQKGGVVVIDSTDPLVIAHQFGAKTGRPFSEAVEMIPQEGKIGGFYDPSTGLTFLVGPNLDPVTGPAVLLHEMAHGQQRKSLDNAAASMLMDRANVKDAELRSFLDRVANAMIDAGEGSNKEEALSYIVERAVVEGRTAGHAVADNRFLAWVDSTLGQRIGDLIRGFAKMVRQWMLRNGLPVSDISVDDLVSYAMAGVDRAARGQVATDSASIAFSRSGVRDIASKATAELNRTFNAPGKLSYWHKSVGTMYNLAERAPAFKPVFKAAQGFIDDVAYYAADAADMAPKLLPKLETWRDITKSPISAEDNTAVAKPVFEGTLLWGRDLEGKAVLVDTMAQAASKLSPERKGEILVAQGKLPAGLLKAWQALPADKFAGMIDSRYETHMLKPGVVWTTQELRDIHKLNDAQIALYREFRSATDRSLDTMARADMLRFGGKDVEDMKDQVMDAKDVREAGNILRDHLAQLAANIPDRETTLMVAAHGMIERADRVAELQAEGYAPLSRFGKYTVDVVQGDERQYFGLFETKREANLMAERLATEFGADSVSQGTLSDESYKLFAGVTPESLELFGNMLGLDATGDEAKDQAFQDYLRLTKTNRSAMRRLIHRKGIAGFSEDVGRVLASFVYSNARQTAGGLNLGGMTKAIADIPKAQGELKDAAVRLGEYIKNPQEEAQAVRGLLFAQYLGGSVASALVNMSQPLAVTFPWLSQFGGARKAATELGRAAKNIASKNFTFEPNLAAAIKKAEDDGVVSPQEVHQLMAQARGAGSLRPGDGTKVGDARAAAQNGLARFSVAWGKLFGAAEQVNRRITYVAAYRTAVAQRMADPDAFARRAVQETQFVYSKASKMQWGRGAVGGTLMTFKTYSIAYIELMSRLWSQGAEGSQERKDGRKAAMLMIATLMLLSGAGGLPFAEDAEDVIDGAAQLMGYNFSSKKAKESFLAEVFGEDMASFIDKGVTGLPGAPLDISGRLGMGNLIPGTGLFQERTSHTQDVMEIIGPMGDFASRVGSGARKVLSGDIGSGLLEVAPTAFRNAAKGADMAVNDMYRDTKGYKVLDTNVMEAAMKAIGFQPSSVAKVQEANWLNQRSKAFYSMKAQEIRAQWAAGIFEKNADMVQGARDAVADWNTKNPEQPMLIKMPDVLKRVREMGKSKDQRIADTAPKAMRAQMREDLERARAE